MLSKEQKDQIYNLTGILVVGSITAAGFASIGTISGSVMTGIGLGLAKDIIRSGASKIKEIWLSSAHGMLNHDIQHALLRAYLKTLAQLQTEYLKIYEVNLLNEDEKEPINAIRAFFKELTERAYDSFLPSLEKAITEKELKNYLYDKQNIVIHVLWDRINADKLLYTYNQHFRNFLRANLLKAVQLNFAEELKADNKESNKAWRAFQRMLLEGIQADIQAVHASQEIIQRDLQLLPDLKQQLGQLQNSVDSRFPVEFFESGLENAIDELRFELVESLQRIDRTTQRTYETVKNTDTKVDFLTVQMNNLSKQLNTELAVDETIAFEDTIEDSTKSASELEELLRMYSSSLPFGIRVEFFQRILRIVWQTLVYQPIVADKFYKNDRFVNGELADILIPLCKIGLDIEITSSEVKALLVYEIGLITSEEGDLTRLHNELVTRFLRHLFYTQSKTLQSDDIHNLLVELADKNDPYWDKFYMDLHYRDLCEYCLINDEVSKILTSVAERYRLQNPDRPLVLLLPFISSTLKVQQSESLQVVIQKIGSIARICEDVIELRWCVLALVRMLPLYMDEELEYSAVIATFIEEAPRDLVFRSPQLLYVYLNSLLTSFLKRKQPEYLMKYEAQFIQMRAILPLPAAAHLQLEYASALFVATQFLEIQDVSHLKFFETLSSGLPPEETVLLSNQFVNGLSQHTKFSIKDKGTIFHWLTEYIKIMFHIYAERIISDNHLRSLNFRASLQIYSIRPIASKSVISSLQRFITATSKPSSSFCARSSLVFDFVPRNQNIELMMQYIQPALNADQYSIIRSAQGMAKCLYWCYFYGKASDKNKIKQWTILFSEIAMIGIGTPKLHWAYYAGIIYNDVKKEQHFVTLLSFELALITRKVHQLGLRRNETVNIVFSGDVVKIIDSGAAQGSLFAKVLKSDLSNPETWNILATTIFNYRDMDDSISLGQAARLYSLAKCFARSRKLFDQKYCYNYIRCKALEYSVLQSPPDDFFINDVIVYLLTPGSVFFSHRKECVEPFIDLLKNNWLHLSADMRCFLTDNIKRVAWLRKETETGKQFATFGSLLRSTV